MGKLREAIGETFPESMFDPDIRAQQLPAWSTLTVQSQSPEVLI